MPRIYVIRPAIDRFNDLYIPEPNSGCWLWTGATMGEWEYAAFMPDGVAFKPPNGGGRKVIQAHRWSYRHFVGPVPDGMFVCHRCDTPLCVNPDHLFLGTPLDNVRDMMAKGRDRFGGYAVAGGVRVARVSGGVPASDAS